MEDYTIGSRSVEELLHEMGADDFPHANGRSLYQHLMGTQAILRCWSQPDWLCDAGALHSIYGTEIYQRQLVPLVRRSEVQAVAGWRAERLAYLFGIVSRRDLVRQMECSSEMPTEGLRVQCQVGEGDGAAERLSTDEAVSLLVLHLANSAEQDCSADRSPGLRLANLSQLGLLINRMSATVPPIFNGCSETVLPDDESAAREAYLAGLAAMSSDRSTAINHFTKATQGCPWVAEPAVWLAYLNLQEGRPATRSQIAHARRIMSQWGTAWDKRLSYDQWCWLMDFIAQEAVDPQIGPLPAPDDPQDLPRFLDQLEERNWVQVYLGSSATPVAEEPGAGRFQRYVASFADHDSASSTKTYLGLQAQAWHDSADFPLARALEAEYPAIRKEILALDDRQFTPEIEPIPRVGNWNVLFFHERGRRNDEVCERCPVTSRVIETNRTVSTLAGLCYVSRLAPGTQVTPHHGPTNLRLRCHLGIRVPEGNCGIRVDGQTRQWQEGRCLIFDDFLRHEAWNHAAGDRIVLIVDLWHPGLTDEEVALLVGLHRYAAAQAASLSAYWSANNKARASIDDLGDQSC
jgi:aspartyl/asparaginyl beta-hydroxylase (cupin superfamily)